MWKAVVSGGHGPAFGAVALPADGEVPLQEEPVEGVLAQEILGAAGEPGPCRRVAHQPAAG
jgi:hypothetical protein